IPLLPAIKRLRINRKRKRVDEPLILRRKACALARSRRNALIRKRRSCRLSGLLPRRSLSRVEVRVISQLITRDSAFGQRVRCAAIGKERALVQRRVLRLIVHVLSASGRQDGNSKKANGDCDAGSRFSSTQLSSTQHRSPRLAQGS